LSRERGLRVESRPGGGARPLIAPSAKRLAAWIVIALAALLVGCASLPPLESRDASFAQTGTDGTRLGRAVAPVVAAHPGKSGIYPMPIPSDAFAARVLLADAAERTLDLQYYIWHGDQTGYLLFDAAWRAAQRGVRVRILLDDLNTEGLDETIAALDAHPNIEIRLYNPLVYRSARALNFVGDFTRVNRRMHNKAFIADNQAAVAGGRNVGNEYFGAGEDVEFRDLDVLAVGPVVREISAEFDLYWNSASAYPSAPFTGAASPDAGGALEARFAAKRADPESTAYIDAVRATPLVRELIEGRLAFDWTHAEVVRDDPAKTLDAADRTDILLITELVETTTPPRSSFDLVSPYFVPGDEGTAALAKLARRGVRVRVLTNSLAATDVPAVHAGYARRRCDLLRAGVRLYELKPSLPHEVAKPRSEAHGSSATKLHAKTFAVDDSSIFVGSFNFDQRSAKLNTEMGVVIESPVLARRLATSFETSVPNAAYEVRLTTTGATDCSLEWIERTPAGEIHHAEEPGTIASQRAWIEILEMLPIEWLL
jgi:putative cardiolipin synthase